MKKFRVGLLFGGRSVEHQVSITSATSILGALDQSLFEVLLIAVDHDGRWHLGSGSDQQPANVLDAPEVLLPATPGERTLQQSAAAPDAVVQLDVIVPIIHGRGGEDGALQGLLDLAEVPYVGSGVLSSAVQMDKDIAKRLLAAADLPVVPWCVFRDYELEGAGTLLACDTVCKEIGLPAFVKPANSGSSVGISKAQDRDELAAALREATRYDRKVIVEQSLDAREVEIAVLGNEAPEASVPGEIVPTHEFYDYEAKYHDQTTELRIPAPISDDESKQLREMAIQAFRALECEGLARVDFLIDRETGKPYINELNSLPGFTAGSMYPKLWEASGLAYPKLLERLIELALDRAAKRARLETHFVRTGV